jgi:filamentous hemagglutinin family protein
MHDHFVTTRLLGSASVLTLLLAANGAMAAGLPSGGHFVSGKGEIGKAAQSLTVKQSSTTGIIDWSRFSVGKHSSVTFDNGSGATLDRVTGGYLARIAGSLHATGSLYLLNAQGVIVSGSGRVVTGGSFIASSATLSNSAFDDREYRFGNADAKVINRGSITSDGKVEFVGSRVANSGVITAAHVKLRATDGQVLAGGAIRATGNAHRGARILVISNTGETRITGDLTARNRDGSGGSIETSGRKLFIGGKIDAGNGGTWLVDPENLTVDTSAAKTIDASLQAGTNVTLKTTATGTSGPGRPSSGTGNIELTAKLSWNSKATLQLDAYHSVVIHAPVDVAGDGGITLTTGDGASSGYLAFEGGNITFGNLGDRLTIDGTVYTLLGSVKTLVSDAAAHPTGHFALANDYDAASDGTYMASPVAKAFDGTFLGLGNTISHLAIDAAAKDSVGLFSSVGASGTVEDLSLDAVKVVGGTVVGALAGANAGTLKDDSVSGTVNGASEVGGVAGTNTGKIDGDASSAAMIDKHGTQKPGTIGSLVGDLIGDNEAGGLIEDSMATGSVHAADSSDVGGVAGRNAGTVESSHAIGPIHGFNSTGGLVGNNLATVEQSWASARVKGLRYVGGLIGFSDTGNTEDSYSTGVVVADASGRDEGGLVGFLGGSAKVTDCYATGDIDGNDTAGGLVGLSESSIESSYATGAVSGVDDIGGLVGINAVSGSNVGTVTASYSTDSVKGKKDVGGLVGENAGTLSSAYWDTQTSGTTLGVGFQDSGARGNAVKRTTAQLRASLPSGFASSVWGLNSHINDGFPYLLALKSSY